MPIIVNNKVYDQISFNKEEDFEEIVLKLADRIFGEKTIYLNIKRKIKGHNIGVIPDGYLLDMTFSNEPKLFVIENEIVKHDPFSHIGIQMLKFAISYEDETTKIKNIITEEIVKSPTHLKRLEEAQRESKTRNIDAYLSKAIENTDFQGLVIIDEARSELYKVLEKIDANISVLEIKTYKNDSNEFAHEYDTLYEFDEETISSLEIDPDSKDLYTDKQKRRQRRAQCDTIIVPAKEDGFNTEFLQNNQWFAIRIGAAMKERIKYIAAYQVAPVSAVTYIAEVLEIKPYHDTGKYIVYFKKPAEKLEIPKRIKDPNKSPQSAIYVKYDDLIKYDTLDEAMQY